MDAREYWSWRLLNRKRCSCCDTSGTDLTEVYDEDGDKLLLCDECLEEFDEEKEEIERGKL